MGPATSINFLVLINIDCFKGEKGKTIDRYEGLYSAFIHRLHTAVRIVKSGSILRIQPFSIKVLYTSDYDRNLSKAAIG